MDIEMNIDNNKFKKQRIDNSGNNINNYIDIGIVAENFIQKYYTSISTNNIQELIDSKILRDYTSIKYNTEKMQGGGIITFLNRLSEYKINVNSYNYIDSGSRRIDISTVGTLKNDLENLNFNQTFLLCNQDNSWYIKNSIFLTF